MMSNTLKYVTSSKWTAWGLVLLAIFLFGLTLISGSNPADQTVVNQSATEGSEVVASSGNFESFITNNFWLMTAGLVALVVISNMILKRSRSTATTVVGRNILPSLSILLLTLYGLVLGVMALMLVLVPTAWLSLVGGTYQTVAVTMIVVGFFLLAVSGGKRLVVMLMMLAFVYLAFNKPVITSEQIQTMKEDGIGSIPFLTAKPAPAPTPPPAPKLATEYRSDLGDFAPIFLNPGQEREIIKYKDDALCYYPVSGLGIWHRFEEGGWFPGFNNNAWAIKMTNTGSTRIEVQAWREAGTICNPR